MVAFKDRNTKLSSTEVVMSDKDFTEQAIFQAEFPDASFVSFTHFKALREKLSVKGFGFLLGNVNMQYKSS